MQAVVVENLPPRFSSGDFAELFRGAEGTTLKYQPGTGRGYVTFSRATSDAEIDAFIMRTRNRIVDGKHLNCTRVNTILPPNNTSANKCIKVIQIDHLTPEFTFYDVQTLIEQFGNILEIRMAVVKDLHFPQHVSGRAFVEFKEPASAQRVIVEAENNPPRPPQCPRPLKITFAPKNWKALAHPLNATATNAQQTQDYRYHNQPPGVAVQQQPAHYYSMYNTTGAQQTNRNYRVQAPASMVGTTSAPIHPQQPPKSKIKHANLSPSDLPDNWQNLQIMWKEKHDKTGNQMKELDKKLKQTVNERNESRQKLVASTQKYSKLEKRYIALRDKFQHSQKKKEVDPQYVNELRKQNDTLLKELKELKEQYSWLSKHALQLKEQSETQAHRFGNLRALSDRLCPYCSQKCNEADLGIDFLPKVQNLDGGGARKRRKLNEEEEVGEDIFDRIVNAREENGKKEYLVRWAGTEGKEETWEALENICPVLVTIWTTSGPG